MVVSATAASTTSITSEVEAFFQRVETGIVNAIQTGVQVVETLDTDFVAWIEGAAPQISSALAALSQGAAIAAPLMAGDPAVASALITASTVGAEASSQLTQIVANYQANQAAGLLHTVQTVATTAAAVKQIAADISSAHAGVTAAVNNNAVAAAAPAAAPAPASN